MNTVRNGQPMYVQGEDVIVGMDRKQPDILSLIEGLLWR
jgi:hypothetical protein